MTARRTESAAADAFKGARGKVAAAEPIEWPELRRFGGERLPELPVERLPPVLAQWAAETSVALQVSVSLPALMALASLSTACAARFTVSPWQGWTEGVNLYFICTLPPGERKSPAFAAAVRPLLKWEAERRDAEAVDRRREADRWKTAEARVESARKAQELEAADDTLDAGQRYEDALAALVKTPRPRAPIRLVGDDVTPEELARMLEEQGGRFGILSAEGGLFTTITGKRYSKGGEYSLDVILKGHAGDPITVNRIGRPPIHVPRPALVLGLAVQDDVMRDFGGDPALRGRGVVARFLFSKPGSQVGTRAIRPEPVSTETADAYERCLRVLLDLLDVRDGNQLYVATELKFSDEAASLLEEFSRRLEPRLAPDADLSCIADWALKAAGAVARIAALFHLAAAAARGGAPSKEVSAQYVADAIHLMEEYFIPHALAAYGLIGQERSTGLARRIAAWIERHRKKEFTAGELLADLCRPGSAIEGAEDILEPLHLLEERGYILTVDPPQAATGRRRKPKYAVNPAALVTPEVSSESSRTPPRPPSSGVSLDSLDARGGQTGAA